MNIPDTTGAVRVELVVRDQLPPPTERQTRRIRNRLEEFESRQAIEGVSTDTWPRKVLVDETENGVRDRYLSDREWARTAGVDLTPFFSVREGYAPGAETQEDWLVLPAMCLRVFEDESLCAVYPHRTDESCVTVADGVERLRRDSQDGSDQAPASAD